ncbi:type VI secretion system baseplate subunit TssK [Paludibaculum fermentans]|uniref:type VI secretion system baseplate subunit TssK n=1 Tax=Paludibaculum fermentans TaxID=1473598 RepID=UPI003EBECCA9
MKTLSRVVWSEGMHLGPQHFQAQNRYFENLVHFTAANLAYEPWGFAAFQLDKDAIRNGLVTVIHASGIFPDGLVFAVPDPDFAPASRAIAEVFPPMRESVDVFLAISPFQEISANCSAGEQVEPGLRYAPQTVDMPDELTGMDSKQLRLARKNLRILVESELHGELAIPIARVRRDAAGQYVYDATFVPPVLRIQGSERLMVLLRRLVEILDEKSRAVAKPKDLSAGTAAGFSAQGISNAWFLHCVNASLTPLRHLCFSKSGHPEELYTEMARLAGSLCTFGLDSHPANLPLYNHAKLAECFDTLDHHIRTHLELVVPSNCVSIPLTKSANYFWDGPIADSRTLVHSRWIFSIRSKIGEAELISASPRLVKVCSKEFVPKLVARALPGMTLKHIPVPPPAINPRVDYQYFSVDKAGPCWEHIVHSRQVGVYVPGELPDPEIELLVVLES